MTEEAQRALLQAEAEQLRASLFRSISHDLRPPLAKVTASLSTLMQTGQALDPASRQELIVSAHQEMSQLNCQVTNLLEVTDREPDSLVTS